MTNTRAPGTPPDDQQHFFVTTPAEWVTDKDLFHALKRIRGSSQPGWHYWVYWVPLPPDADYKIRNFVPEVDGLEYVGHGVF